MNEFIALLLSESNNNTAALKNIYFIRVRIATPEKMERTNGRLKYFFVVSRNNFVRLFSQPALRSDMNSWREPKWNRTRESMKRGYL